MAVPNDPRSALRDFPQARAFLVAVDSAGCAFDTMEVKHKECFIPNLIRYFDLAAVSRYAREAAEFINLYSRHRGINRFPGLLATIDLLSDRHEVARRHFRLPSVPGLRDWVARAPILSNPALRAEVEATDDPDLVVALQWSEAVNRSVAEIVRGVPPFPFVRESLAMLDGRADVMVCSATPAEAVEREWAEHGLDRHASMIAGQEHGPKRDQLALASSGRYEPSRVLMIGDAPGDLDAAEANGILFFPIVPGREDESWRLLHDDALPRFFAGNYHGAYMDGLVARFQGLLPGQPPWKSA